MIPLRTEYDFFTTYSITSNGLRRFHREDGPAVIYNNGLKMYYCNGKLHRLDGPAVEWPGLKNEWYVNDRHVTTEIYQWAKEMNIDLNNLSDQDKQMIALYWGNYEK